MPPEVREPELVPVPVCPLFPLMLAGVVPVIATVLWSSLSTTTSGSSSGRNRPCSNFDSSRLE